MGFRTVVPPEARPLIDADHVYLDVRTTDEFDAGHPAGAYNVPFATFGDAGMQANPDFVAVVRAHFPADAKLVVGCAAGGRSLAACEALAAAGFSALVNMHCGFGGARTPSGEVEPGWAALGYPVEETAPAERCYAHLRTAIGGG